MHGRWYWILVLVMAWLLVGVACVPITPPVSTAPEEATEEAGGETTETMATTVPSAAEAPELTGVLTGTVRYLARVALPPGSVIEVQLQDVSRQDVAATVVASHTITTAGENVPIPFALIYDPAEIDARMTYAISVRITIEGQLRWINTERYAVLTRGAPVTEVEVLVRSAQ